MLRRQYSQLLSDLRAELGRNNDPGVRASDLAELQYALTQTYEQEYAGYDWPHLRRVFPRISLAAGQRYYDFPDTSGSEMDFDRMETVAVWHNSLPIHIAKGIGFEEYATYDSENDNRSDPVQRWDVRFTGTKEQIEVWPIPSSNNQTLQFIGIKKFEDLVDDSDPCLLDDNLIVLKAAQGVDSNDKRVQRRAIRIARLEASLKANAKSGADRVRMGLGVPARESADKAVVRISG